MANEQNQGTTDTNGSEATKSQAPSRIAVFSQFLWNWTCWSSEKTFDSMEFAGEVLANFFGLTQSKYQWILDAQEREDEEMRQRQVQKRQRRQLRLEQLVEIEQKKLQELETGSRELNS